MILDFLIQPVTGLVSDVLKRVLPAEKMTEAERLKLEAEINLALMKYDWNKIELEFKDRDSARRLAEADVAKGNAFTNVLAASVRPLFGFACLAIFIWTALGPQFGLKELTLTDNHRLVMETVIYFYFGARTIEKGVAMYTQAKR